jgi:ubiquinone/menaquinone biosynthesis C-methylase UbiE
MERKNHWERIYSAKQPNQVSWTQDVPKTSLAFIHNFNLSKTASIIDIGGGDSKLVDYLIAEGYMDITVLDISEAALSKARQRLGKNADKVNWIVCDVTEFKACRRYDCWHDRATFHFLTTNEEIAKYLDLARNTVKENGFVAIGTFSEQGPDQCSGLSVKKYSEYSLQEQLKKGFEKLRCFTEDHITPFRTIQNFLFCSFRRQLSV